MLKKIMLPLVIVMLSAACISGCDSYPNATEAVRDKPSDQLHPVGLCVRTARDGYVILEARLVQSSGDANVDAVALKDVIGAAVPIPNQRMWLEWLPTRVGGNTDGDSASSSSPSFDCADLEREARAKADVR